MAEMRGFVFSLIFIVVFAGLLIAVPIGLNGAGTTPEELTPLDPNFVLGYANTENFSTSDFSSGGLLRLEYQYVLNSATWIMVFYEPAGPFTLYIATWFSYEFMNFVSLDSTTQTDELNFYDINDNAVNGQVVFKLISVTTGKSHGELVIWWNTTLYTGASDAWNNNALYFVHGQGFDEGATSDMGALLLNLLTLQLPNVPILVNLLLATPIWATMIYVIWYVVKEMIPFV